MILNIIHNIFNLSLYHLLDDPLVSCAVFLMYTVITELRCYYRYPTISNTYIKLEERLTFPAITVCNLSPRKYSSFSNNTKSKNFQMSYSTMRIYSTPINWSDPYYQNEGYFRKRTQHDIYSESKNRSTFLYYVMFDNIPQGSMYRQTLFKPVITDMGVCLRANTDGKLVTSMHGALFNLHLQINVLAKEDYFSISFSSGVKVNIAYVI